MGNRGEGIGEREGGRTGEREEGTGENMGQSRVLVGVQFYVCSYTYTYVLGWWNCFGE